jgi:hypothetical protein
VEGQRVIAQELVHDLALRGRQRVANAIGRLKQDFRGGGNDGKPKAA